MPDHLDIPVGALSAWLAEQWRAQLEAGRPRGAGSLGNAWRCVTLAQVAEALGRTERTVRRLFRGERSMTAGECRAVAKVLGVDLEFVVPLEGEGAGGRVVELDSGQTCQQAQATLSADGWQCAARVEGGLLLSICQLPGWLGRRWRRMRRPPGQRWSSHALAWPELAEAVGVSIDTLRRWLNGEQEATIGQARDVAEALGVDVEFVAWPTASDGAPVVPVADDVRCEPGVELLTIDGQSCVARVALPESWGSQ